MALTLFIPTVSLIMTMFLPFISHYTPDKNKPVIYGLPGGQFPVQISEAKEIKLYWNQSVFSFGFSLLLTILILRGISINI